MSLLRILDNTIMYFLSGIKKFFTFTKAGAQWTQRNKQSVYADSENISALKSAKIKFNKSALPQFLQNFLSGCIYHKIQSLQSYYSTTTRHSDCDCMQIAVTEYFWSYFRSLWQQSYYSYIICLHLFFCYLHSELFRATINLLSLPRCLLVCISCRHNELLLLFYEATGLSRLVLSYFWWGACLISAPVWTNDDY